MSILTQMRACPHCCSSYVGEIEYCGIDGTRLIETDEDPLIGQTIDRYRVVSLLGRGAMGSVYRAQHLSLHRDFALKVLYGDFAANHTLISRFDREATALSRIRHSAIVSVVDFIATEAGLNVLIMDFLPGRTLDDMIQQEAPISVERTASFARQMASGLAEVHRVGIIHRDVKPSNVLMVPEGGEETVKLVDFGVVAVDDDQREEAAKLTAQGRILGTPRYMAPEQARQLPTTKSADLYSLGVVMFEMLTGEPPFPGEGITDVLVKHVTLPPPPLPPSGGLEHLVERLLAKDPSHRPASGYDVIEEIDRLQEAGFPNRRKPVIATLADKEEALAPPEPESRRRSFLLGAGALGLAAVIGIGVVLAREEPPQPQVEPIPTVVPPPPIKEKKVVVPPRKTRKVKRRPRKRSPRKARPEHVRKLGQRLKKALRRRGLTFQDVKRIPATKTLASQWSSALSSRDKDDLERLLPRFIKEIEAVKLERKILVKRLDRFHKAMRASRREVPENLLKEVEGRYFDLRPQVHSVRSDKQFKRVAERVRLLERKLAKLRYGD